MRCKEILQFGRRPPCYPLDLVSCSIFSLSRDRLVHAGQQRRIVLRHAETQPIGNVPPAEAEAAYYAAIEPSAIAA